MPCNPIMDCPARTIMIWPGAQARHTAVRRRADVTPSRRGSCHDLDRRMSVRRGAVSSGGRSDARRHLSLRHLQARVGRADDVLRALYRRGLPWLGSPPKRYRSSPSAERGFCPQCGSTLSMHESVLGDRVQVALAVSTIPSAPAPTITSGPSSNCPGCTSRMICRASLPSARPYRRARWRSDPRSRPCCRPCAAARRG